MSLGPKEQEILDFLNGQVFEPMLKSPLATLKLKQDLRTLLAQLEGQDAPTMIRTFTAAATGTGRQGGLTQRMHAEGFVRIETIVADFRSRFDQRWLRS